jgi:hypothetical protein
VKCYPLSAQKRHPNRKIALDPVANTLAIDEQVANNHLARGGAAPCEGAPFLNRSPGTAAALALLWQGPYLL